MHRYEICYESATASGSRLVLASSPEEALARFHASYEAYDNPVPSHWIAATWAIG
jgi:hypothetical protein